MDKIKIIAVVGPTASGKTQLSVELAKHYDGEIVSADSMQIYKGMKIATAKPGKEEMCGIKHYMIDFLDPEKPYSVGQYVIDADNAIRKIISNDKLPIVCGGTGLYVDSLLNAVNFVENSSDETVRKHLYDLFREKGVDYLLDMLSKFDYDSYAALSQQKNTKRIIRAIEFYMTTGMTISQQKENSMATEPKYDSLIIGLTADDRQFLYDRINKRVDVMLEKGLLCEAQQVLSSDLSSTASKAIGYKEFIPYFNGEDSLADCVEKLKRETRRYAKRQLTWFRRNEKINWINIDEYNSLSQLTERAVDIIDKKDFLYG